jgi:hypothetical protein
MQILDRFTLLFEVGHTSPPPVQMHKLSHGLTSDLSPGTSNRGHDDPAHLGSVVTAADHKAGIGARLSAFPISKPHTARRGAFALCDSPHGINEGLP